MADLFTTIIKDKNVHATKTMIYALPGVGKSTLASKLTKPFFIDIEGGLNHIKADKTPTIGNIVTFYEWLIALYKVEKREYNYIVIDSIDWLVRKTIEQVAGIGSQNSIAELDNSMELTLNRAGGGYGNGKQILENHIRSKMLMFLQKLIDKGYGIVLIAHAERKTLMDSDGTNSEIIAPKIDTNTMHTFVEWCDNIFYLKKVGEGRKLLVDSDMSSLAKNRLALSGELDVKGLNLDKLLAGKVEYAKADETK